MQELFKDKWRVAVVLSLAVPVPLLGIAVDRYTDLSAQAFLLYFTVIGAFAAAWAAHHQVVETRRAVDAAYQANSIADTNAKRQVRPLITVDRLRKSRGYWEALIKNHGGGVAIDLNYESVVHDIPADGVLDYPTFDDWRPSALRYDEAAVPEKSLGSGEERWVALGPVQDLAALGPEAVMVYWRFSYSTLYEERESNETGPQALRLAPALVVEKRSRIADGRAQLVLRLSNTGIDAFDEVDLQVLDLYSWNSTVGWATRSDWGSFPAQLKWSPNDAILTRLNPGGIVESVVAVYRPSEALCRIGDVRPPQGTYRLDLLINVRRAEARYEQVFIEWSPAAFATPGPLGDDHLRWVSDPET